MDLSLLNKRETALKEFFNNKNKTDDLEFLDLELYLKPKSISEKIRRNMHLSKIDEAIVLTKYQIEILEILENGNIFLSAPTSFGKTYILLEFIKRNTKLKNIVIIIPTLALMNELIIKLYDYFGDDFNLCINSDEKFEDKNIFVFVPERSDALFLEKIKNLSIDLLVFDEIYKLQGSQKLIKSDDRLIYMNKVYLDLVEEAKKVALLGPYINNVNFENTKLEVTKYITNYMPVYNEIITFPNENSWIEHVRKRTSLIYFKSPESIYKSVYKILEILPEDDYFTGLYRNEILHLEQINSKEWYVVDLLKRGIGIHHGKTPMFLRKFYESEYNNHRLNTLLCTSTLMEGINTPTQNLIIVDDPGSPFKFSNLIGRVGRLNPNNPNAGNVFISEQNLSKYLQASHENWLELIILAEDKKVYSNNEILYLKKTAKNEQMHDDYYQGLDLIKNNFNKNENDLVKYNVDYDIALKFVKENYKPKFEMCSSVYDCIKLTVDLIRAPSFMFSKSNYMDLQLSIKFLPYKVYINKIINGVPFLSIINDFNELYNTSKNTGNINKLIDALYVLTNYIKFKFSNILNYFELFDISKQNEAINHFIYLLSTYNVSKLLNKILDDLGIEMEDVEHVSEVLNLNEIISTSKVIKSIREKKDKLNEAVLNAFTKNNINNI